MSVFTSNGSGNPLLSERSWDGQSLHGNFAKRMSSPAGTMSLSSTAFKTLALLGIVVVTAALLMVNAASLGGWLMIATLGGTLLGCVLVVVCGFAPKASPWLAVPIALCEGALAGGSSIIYSAQSATAKSGIISSLGSSIVIQAVLLTLGIAASMLLLYASRIIKVTERFRMILSSAIMGIFFASLITLVLSLFGVRVPYLWDGGIVSILFSGFVVVTASFTLALDFDRIEQGAASGQPKHMEWYASIALLVSLVWLYISVLRLLSMLRRND